MSKVSAASALSKLKAGNKRFVSEKQNFGNLDMPRRKETTGGQAPFAIVLSCADSRVLPEMVFDVGIGEIFVCRVAGNIANTCSIASIEYAVAHLGTKLIVVLGHESCGAVGAALQNADCGHNLNALLAHLKPAVDATPGRNTVDKVVKQNAKMQAVELKSRSAIIGKAKGIKIVPAFYNLNNGKVDFL